MNLPQLCQYSEGLAKMLASGIDIKQALRVAGRCMAARENRRFAARMAQALLSGDDLPEKEFSGSLPPFYRMIVECGILTGRLPQALGSAAYYVRQVLPVRHTLRRCGWYTLFAYLICIVTTWIFQSRLSFFALLILVAFHVLPKSIETLAYQRDAILVKMPFAGTWIQQVSLLEFFSCLDVCYDSTLSVPDMFEHSRRAVGNLALRRQLLESKVAVERGDSFADALRRTPFIPRGMVTDVRANELCGKLELSFHGFAQELRKLIEAKLEPIKAYAAGWVITYGLLIPLTIVLPVFIKVDWLPWYLMIVVGDLWVICTYMAIVNYRDKRIDVNCWWEGLRDTEDMPQ